MKVMCQIGLRNKPPGGAECDAARLERGAGAGSEGEEGGAGAGGQGEEGGGGGGGGGGGPGEEGGDVLQAGHLHRAQELKVRVPYMIQDSTPSYKHG